MLNVKNLPEPHWPQEVAVCQIAMPSDSIAGVELSFIGNVTITDKGEPWIEFVLSGEENASRVKSAPYPILVSEFLEGLSENKETSRRYLKHITSNDMISLVHTYWQNSGKIMLSVEDIHNPTREYVIFNDLEYGIFLKLIQVKVDEIKEGLACH